VITKGAVADKKAEFQPRFVDWIVDINVFFTNLCLSGNAE
jgi:hypothetical protein